MQLRSWAAVLGVFATLSTSADAAKPESGGRIAWKTTTIEGKFRSEGVAAADVNKDGKLDVLLGDGRSLAVTLVENGSAQMDYAVTDDDVQAKGRQSAFSIA